TARVWDSYRRLPMSFEANAGQTEAGVQFLARGPGYTVALTPTEAVFTLTEPPATTVGRANAALGPVGMPGRRGLPAPVGPGSPADTSVVRMQLLGSNPAPRVTGLEALPGRVNYLRGQDRAQWHTGVPTYAKVKYQHIYPGVDLVYYGNQQQLEYDFVVAPGASAGAITLAFAGADRVELNAGGDLVLHTAAGEMHERKPFIYQEANGVRQEI